MISTDVTLRGLGEAYILLERICEYPNYTGIPTDGGKKIKQFNQEMDRGYAQTIHRKEIQTANYGKNE